MEWKSLRTIGGEAISIQLRRRQPQQTFFWPKPIYYIILYYNIYIKQQHYQNINLSRSINSMRPIRNPPSHSRQIINPITILRNPNNQTLLLQPQQQPLNKLLIPCQLSRNVHSKNQLRKHRIQIRKNLLRYPLYFLITNPRHPLPKTSPFIFFFLPQIPRGTPSGESSI